MTQERSRLGQSSIWLCLLIANGEPTIGILCLVEWVVNHDATKGRGCIHLMMSRSCRPGPYEGCTVQIYVLLEIQCTFMSHVKYIASNPTPNSVKCVLGEENLFQVHRMDVGMHNYIEQINRTKWWRP